MYKAIVSALLCLSVLGSGAATARTDYESRLTHEEVLDLGAKLRDGTPDSQATLNRAADTLHLSPAALRIFFRILEDRKVAADEASFKLGEIVTCHRAALDRLDLLRASAISETLKEAARTAIAAGDYAEANVALATAGQVNRERAGQHGQTAHSYRSDTADLAFVPALLTLGQFDYLAAARQFMTIASMSTSDRDSAHWFAIWALENQVRTHDDRNALAMAIEVHRTRLRELDRGKDLEGWAKAQVSFGDTLAKLGTRDKAQAAERLEEAVVAYRLAISTVGREAGPTGWAEIQLKLGEALEKLGERGADAARLEEAATAFRLALEEFPRDRELENWRTYSTTSARPSPGLPAWIGSTKSTSGTRPWRPSSWPSRNIPATAGRGTGQPCRNASPTSGGSWIRSSAPSPCARRRSPPIASCWKSQRLT